MMQGMELFLIWLGFALVTAIIAESKGRSGFGWLVAGIFFGFFAFIAVAFMPAVEKKRQAMPNLGRAQQHHIQ
jgi:hypothetical protein